MALYLKNQFGLNSNRSGPALSELRFSLDSLLLLSDFVEALPRKSVFAPNDL
jgi:hypothetical protein